MWKGQLTFEAPMLFSIGFLVTFLFGGLTGVLLAAPPIDFHVHDTYFVVGHFHYVLFGTIVFATFAGIYFWFPKMTGRMLSQPLGRLHFWTTFIGFHTTFLVHHWLGAEGMPRRYADYLATDQFTTLHAISTVGAFTLGLSTLPFIWNVLRSYRYGEPANADDPWGFGNSLEWATSCPPLDTISPSCPESAPNAQRSNCTTHTWSNASARNPGSIRERTRNARPHPPRSAPPQPSRKTRLAIPIPGTSEQSRVGSTTLPLASHRPDTALGGHRLRHALVGRCTPGGLSARFRGRPSGVGWASQRGRSPGCLAAAPSTPSEFPAG
jgi:Cytochrome C and Quinol oxidase polypeptide I